MKKVLLTIVAFIGFTVSFAATDFIYLTPVSGSTGSVATVYVKMTNPRINVCAFQCDVILPEGATMIDNTLKASDRCSGFSISAKPLGDGVYRILCYSPGKSLISGTAGNVASFSVRIGATMSAGTYTYNLKNIVMADENCISTLDQNGNDAQMNVNSNYQVGDLNRDHRLDVADLTFWSKNAWTTNLAGDLNDDGKVDSVDLGILTDKVYNANY